MNNINNENKNYGAYGGVGVRMMQGENQASFGDNENKGDRVGGNYRNHNVEIIDRHRIMLTGVEKVKNINETLFVGKVAGYGITVQGENMELTKLDLDSGVVEITGTINGLKYTGKNANQSLFKRLFK